MQFADRLTIDRSHRTKDGYLRVVAKAARSGIQHYLGREVDPEGKTFKADQVVNVYRPPEEVFDKAALASFVGRPITDDHPSEAVNAANWRDHSRGVVGGAVKDGEWIRFDLALMDASTIDKVDAGKRELSAGYACELAFEDGKTPDGAAYQAVQRNIRGNHVAVVDRARAGSDARISDGGNKLFENCDAATVILTSIEDQEPRNMPHTLIIDGLQVPNVSDEAKAAIEKLQGQVSSLTQAKDAAETKVGELTATVATKDGEVAGLNAKLKDAEVTPAKLQQMAADRAKVIAAAQTLKPGIVVDGRTDVEIRKEAVETKLGDAVKAMDDNAISGAFLALTKDAKVVDHIDPITTPKMLGDGADTRNLARSLQYN